MPEEATDRYRHLILRGNGERSRYKRPNPPPMEPMAIPEQDRAAHSHHLLGQLERIEVDMRAAIQTQDSAGLIEDKGICIEFESFPEIGWVFDTLPSGTSGIELLNIQHREKKTFATVFVPDGKLRDLVKKVEAYQSRRTNRNGKPRDYRDLINTIENIKLASLRALWTDTDEAFPTESDAPFWWEAWLTVRGNRNRSVREFKDMTAFAGLSTSSRSVSFPERIVVLVQADLGRMRDALPVLTTVAELRRAKDTAAFFTGLVAYEEKPWVDDLLARTSFSDTSEAVPRVCVLDTGVNRGHPLLAGSIDAADMSTIRPDWGTADAAGHGTGIAGLSLYGDLTELLASAEPVLLEHRLESSKLLVEDGGNTGDEHLHADLTRQAVYNPQIAYPDRKRVFELAVSASDYRDEGRPSAWSAAIDQLTAASGDDSLDPRLFVVAAGNITDNHVWERYPESLDGEGIHDPGQSWNALTAGAYTEKVDVDGERTSGYRPIATAGDLSPFTTTSTGWEKPWPIKPDVVMEGGNAARDAFGAIQLDALSLLTTNRVPSERLLTAFNATSAASALVARMAARIMAAYPDLRPETIRGIIVHSARWTDAMLYRYGIASGSSKEAYMLMARQCGFGVPDMDRALWSLSNSVTLVMEDELTPFVKGSPPRLNEAKYYKLPWPADILSDLGSTDIEMRVTLSYYIEPNPSSRGRAKYYYESHGLRFDVKRPTESEEQFRCGKNAHYRQTPMTGKRPAPNGWLLGENNRHRGSVHSDIWRGTAAELASCGSIVVYPTGGWWQKRPALEKFDSVAHYSLIASIAAPEIDVDLYTPIENTIKMKVSIPGA